MNRTAQSLILVLLGVAVLRIGVTDQYLRYVKEGLRPFLLAAGLLLLVTAVATWRHREHEHEHGHGHRVAWLLALPALVLLVLAPPPLGSGAVNQAGTAIDGRSAADFPALPDGDPVPVTMLDYAARAVFDQGGSLHGRRVRLTGFLATGPAGEPLLVRMMLTCCASDARPVKIGLRGRVPALPPDTWLEVTGTRLPETATDEVNGQTIPFLHIESARQVPAPPNAYE
ncbi:TIGR03943 family protein [Crossiella cryophila]